MAAGYLRAVLPLVQGVTTSGTSFVANSETPPANILAGTLLVLTFSCDNASATTPVISIAESTAGYGNTWTIIQQQVNQTVTTAGGSLVAGVAYCYVTVPILRQDQTITFTTSVAVTAMVIAIAAYTGTKISQRDAQKTTLTATANIASTAPVAGDLVIGYIGAESLTIPTGDADTTNGSWATAHSKASSTGTTLTSQSVLQQYKIVTTTGTQTFDGTGTGDTLRGIVVFAPADPPGAPTGVSVAGVNGGAHLSWTAPASDGGAPLTNYVIEYSLAGAGSWTSVNTQRTATTGAVAGLLPSTSYDFRVSAASSTNGTTHGTVVGTASSTVTTTTGVGAGTPLFYAVGQFIAARGVGVNRVVRMTDLGFVDGTWNMGANPGVGSWGKTGTNAIAYAIEQATDGSGVYVGGILRDGRRVERTGVSRLLASTGAIDTNFDPFNTETPSGQTIRTVKGQSAGTGNPLVAGSFANISGSVFNGIARIRKYDGLRETNFNQSGTNGVSGGFNPIMCMIVQPDNFTLIGGGFNTAKGVTQNGLARLNLSGNLDVTFNTGGTVGTDANATIFAMALQPDGKVILGGNFATMRGSTAAAIMRVLADGTVDTSWDVTGTNGVSGVVYALALQPDGMVIVGGTFLTARGTTVNRIIRLTSTGTVDPAWDLTGTIGADNTVRGIVLQDDGKIIIGGAFLNARGTLRNYLARLNSDGSLDTSFNNANIQGMDGIIWQLSRIPDPAPNAYIYSTTWNARNRAAVR